MAKYIEYDDAVSNLELYLEYRVTHSVPSGPGAYTRDRTGERHGLAYKWM